jgi:hypothetical protein
MPTAPSSPLLLWDLFCQVIDNHGDLGVCWRLAAQLAARGQRVRLWVDDARALAWMAPGAVEGHLAGIQVLPWTRPFHAGMPPEAMAQLPRADVWIEAFGCEIASEFIALQRHSTLGNGQNRSIDPVWINLEYLSAEPYVERCHGLPSPVMHGPGQGLTRHFFYPGFTPRTGGLLREPDLAGAPGRRSTGPPGWLARASACRLAASACCRCSATNRRRWGPGWPSLAGRPDRPTHAAGDPWTGCTRRSIPGFKNENGHIPSVEWVMVRYRFHTFPALTQVRLRPPAVGLRPELRARRGLAWCAPSGPGRPFVWQIYPQHDGAHACQARSLPRTGWMHAGWFAAVSPGRWNGIADTDAGARTRLRTPGSERPAWTGLRARGAASRLLAQDDLATQLCWALLAKKR